MSDLGPCTTCQSRAADAAHRVRCAYETGLRTGVELRADELEIPRVEARDLLAHMRHHGNDPILAAQKAITVMDLGWRPTMTRSR